MKDIKYDDKIDVATGAGAGSRTWRNRKMKWSALVERLLQPHYTTETIAQFLRLSKEDQGKIKDVGGYVGGYLRAGRRKPANLVHRQLITLDIDFAKADIWENLTRDFDNAALLHGTHKHTDESPRYRLIMPLNREVSYDEYLAIGRAVAGTIGIELFDNTGFQPERLMFWPSSPSDVEYYSEFQDGPWLDADEILNSYVDWKDSSAWPTSVTETERVKGVADKQADPNEKRGIVGSFCRAYTIEEAIETFLTDKYAETTDGRYTYLEGSAASGLVTYNGKFAFSHHGTDPCSGKLCNSFDLVRIHKYGHLDPDTKPAGKAPSFKEMELLATSDKKVKTTIAADLLDSARVDFAINLTEEQMLLADVSPAEAVPEKTKKEKHEAVKWMGDMDVDNRGNYLSSSHNLNLIFANDPRIKKIFKYNAFSGKAYLVSSPPWRHITEPEPVRNVDNAGVRNYIETLYGISGIQKIKDSMLLEFEKQKYHPVREYFSSLVWDGTPRVDYFLSDFFGVESTLYHREAIRKTLVGGVARILNPGVKFDLVLTLVGGQGTGKSTFVTKMGKGWSSDTFMTVSGKEAFEQIQGFWIIEIAELSGFKKSDVESVKHYLSKQEDSYRPAYAEGTETFKRQCIFIATTNNKDFLKDPTGDRRFLPVNVDSPAAMMDIFTELTPLYVDQLWAEAVSLFKDGEPLFMSKEAEEQAKVKQRQHSESDYRRGLVEEYLSIPLPEDWDSRTLEERRMFITSEDKLAEKGSITRDYVCVAELWCECLGKAKADMDRYKTVAINDILRSLEGWEQSSSTKRFSIYGTQKYYKRT